MKQPVNPPQLQEVGQHFYRFIEHHIEELEKNYLIEMPSTPFIHHCFQNFLDHYERVYNTFYNQN